MSIEVGLGWLMTFLVLTALSMSMLVVLLLQHKELKFHLIKRQRTLDRIMVKVAGQQEKQKDVE